MPQIPGQTAAVHKASHTGKRRDRGQGSSPTTARSPRVPDAAKLPVLTFTLTDTHSQLTRHQNTWGPFEKAEVGVRSPSRVEALPFHAPCLPSCHSFRNRSEAWPTRLAATLSGWATSKMQRSVQRPGTLAPRPASTRGLGTTASTGVRKRARGRATELSLMPGTFSGEEQGSRLVCGPRVRKPPGCLEAARGWPGGLGGRQPHGRR